MESIRIRQILGKQEALSAQRLLRPTIVRTLDVTKEINTPEILIITGVRRSGKSLLLSQIKKQFQATLSPVLVEFDDPALSDFHGADFAHLVEICAGGSLDSQRKKLLLLDEIQNVPDWQRWLPQLAKDPSVKIIVTGSNATLLSSELGTLLTGRHTSRELTPLSYREIVGFEHSHSLGDKLSQLQLLESYQNYYQFGGFPRSYVDRDPAVLPQYFADIVERDVVVRHGSRLKKPLKELSRILCSDNTRLLNRSRLAKQLGVRDDATIKRYCSWLEECYLFHELKGFSPSVRKQIRSNPKYYCVDPTLARYSGFTVLGDDGSFLENMVYLELRRSGYELHYWRASTVEAEVDFICRRGGSAPKGVQVSLTVADEGTLRREIGGLLALYRELGISDLVLITKCDQERSLQIEGAEIQIVPFIDWARQ